MADYLVEPDGTISWDPTEEDFERVRDEEHDLLHGSEE